MKIKFSDITACGECCKECNKKAEGICQGCIESDGHCKEWEQTGRCPIYTCARIHKVQFCGICPEFPCDDLTVKIPWNKNIVEHLSKLAKEYKQQDT